MKLDKISDRKKRAKFYIETTKSLLKSKMSVSDKEIIYFTSSDDYIDFFEYIKENKYRYTILKDAIYFDAKHFEEYLKKGMPKMYATIQLF